MGGVGFLLLFLPSSSLFFLLTTLFPRSTSLKYLLHYSVLVGLVSLLRHCGAMLGPGRYETFISIVGCTLVYPALLSVTSS